MTAWLLATDPDPTVRNGAKALPLAQRATDISQGRNSRVLLALAAAYAENGDFVQAARTIEQANRLPDRSSAALMFELQRRYQAGVRFYYDKPLLLMPPGYINTL